MDLVNSLDYYDEENSKELYEDVAAAEASEADYVIVMMHFGYEYQAWKAIKFKKHCQGIDCKRCGYRLWRTSSCITTG